MRGTIEINWSLSDCVTVDLVTFRSPALGCSRRSSVVTRAVNQNRNARWADSEERLFGLTPDLGHGARLTLAGVPGGTQNRKFNRQSDLLSLSLFVLAVIFFPSLFLSLFIFFFPFLHPGWPGLQADDNVRSLLFMARAQHRILRVIYRWADV